MSAAETILEADEVVVEAVRAFLKRARVGGMPEEEARKVEGAIAAAAQLRYFSIALAQHAGRKKKAE